jgi:DNA-directed RNA polymerase subunit L
VSTSASNEVLELREKLASLQALLNKSVHGIYNVLPRNLADEPSVKSSGYETVSHQITHFLNLVVTLQSSTLS